MIFCAMGAVALLINDLADGEWLDLPGSVLLFGWLAWGVIFNIYQMTHRDEGLIEIQVRPPMGNGTWILLALTGAYFLYLNFSLR